MVSGTEDAGCVARKSVVAVAMPSGIIVRSMVTIVKVAVLRERKREALSVKQVECKRDGGLSGRRRVGEVVASEQAGSR